MPYEPGPRDRPGRLRRCTALIALLIAGASAGVLAPAAAASASAPGGPSHLLLTEQTSWLSGKARLTIGLALESALASADLGVRLRVYSCLSSRSAFESTLTPNSLNGQTPIDAPRTIPLADLRPRRSGTDRDVLLSLHAIGATSASPGSVAHPNLALSCSTGGSAGVYPLDVALVALAGGRTLASFVTHLVYTQTGGTGPLHTAIVLPLGASPALGPASTTSPLGTSSIRPGQATALAGAVAALRASSKVPVSLEIFPQLVLGLDRARLAPATSALGDLRSIADSGAEEVLRAPFADVDPASLASDGLSGEFNAQLARAAPTLSSLLGARAATPTYVSAGNLNAAALRLLQADGVRDLVLPETSYSLDGALASGLTQTAPFVLTASSTGASVVAAGADPGLAKFFDEPSDTVLAAHDLLADLAQIYFDRPNAAETRGVIVAPTSWTPDETFLATLLSGLGSSPILRAVTVKSWFRTVPIGGNGDVNGATLVASAPVPGASAAAVHRALDDLATTTRVVPGNASLREGLRDSIFLGESTGITAGVRGTLLGAPRHALAQISSTLSFGGGTTISLTEQHARLPITILSASGEVVHATLVLESNELLFAKGAARRPVVLAHKDNPEYLPVSTRAAGSSSLSASLLAPGGGYVLLRARFTVVSTAYSAVAIGISVVALIILAIWWFRSVARHRRRVRAERERSRGGPAPGPGPEPEPEPEGSR